jgi:lysylphosphatidylglycerol synthetase-like protein (DUF2156 family)
MSDTPANFSFPHRTPVFTAAVVIVCFAAFAWLAKRIYVPHAHDVQPVEGVRTPADRARILAEHRQAERDGNSYGWIDQKAGVVRLPIDRAIELTVRDYSKK